MKTSIHHIIALSGWNINSLHERGVKVPEKSSGNRIVVFQFNGKRCEICFGNTTPERVDFQNASPLTPFGFRRSQARTVNPNFITSSWQAFKAVLALLNPLLVDEKRFHILKKEAKIVITNNEFNLNNSTENIKNFTV